MLFQKRAGLREAVEFRGDARHPLAAHVELRLAVVERLRAGANQFREAAGEETVERAHAAWQHDVNVPPMRNAGARDRSLRFCVPIEQRNAAKVAGKGARGYEPSDACADHNGVLTVR
jgi:hypothetical protein